MSGLRLDNQLFKKLSPDNWREVDQAGSHIVQIKADGTIKRLGEDDWASLVLEHELSEKAPKEIRNLFEVARGVFCYGCYFYPLYTLGSEQLFRVLEASILARCTRLGAPKKVRKFVDAIDWMKAEGNLDEHRYTQWDALRRLRNSSSHADKQSLYDQTMAMRNLATAVELINELFDNG